MGYLDDYDPPLYTDADVATAEMNAWATKAYAAEKAGRCTHGSVAGYRVPAVYPEQVGLKPGQSRCMDGCGQVFESDEHWWAEVESAVEGE